MCQRMLKLFLYLLCIKTKDALAREFYKFVDQRDMSEHCRRRVVPSVFLGEHVTDANSQIMQFSQLEVPYSCSLSVRAEAGNNIILIIQLLSEESLIKACELSGDQLIVYELGETFGGYWGPIPNVIMRESDKKYTQYYTLKTTRPPTTRKPKPKTTQLKPLQHTETQSTVTEQVEYYTMDVPIVNVSGDFQLGPRRETNDSEDLFNYIYDVTPRNGVEYETSIMPLVQFSIRQQSNGYEGEVRRYNLDYDSKGFTMDPRLIFNTAKKKKTSFRRDWKANRGFRHRTKSTNIFRRRDHKKLYTVRPYITEVSEAVTPSMPILDSNYFTNSWELVDDIMRSINVTSERSTVFQNETFRNIIDNISKSRHNSSVYLTPNISMYNVDVSTRDNETIFEDRTDLIKSIDNSKLVKIERALGIPTTSLLRTSIEKSSRMTLDLSTLKTDNYLITKNKNTNVNIPEITRMQGLQIDETNMTTDKLNAKNEIITEITTESSTIMNYSNKTPFLTGAMVGHESFENIVQAAPVMAVVLNNTEPPINNTITNVSNKRKYKRYIQSLEIDQSRPRNLTTKGSLVSEEQPLEDIHDMARLVELEDDEMGSRVALRYLRHYAGPAIYNLCDHREQNLRQMFLFNSSRIVIAVSNFTLDQMMLVLTPAQTLPSGVSQCPRGQLECQIVGTRVCIDSLNACDGVPNCGSYEIYDEDRLTCGTSHGVQHNVYLAALTFLAVILTAAYITLYWLERCVPRVSDAFFVYSDSSENELFLQSVMRSPNEDEDSSYKINYLGHFFEDDLLYQDLNAEPKKGNVCKKIFNACWQFLCFKKAPTSYPLEKVISEDQLQKKEPSRMFTFAQLELRKFGNIEFKDEGVQTSASFELRHLNFQQNKNESLNSLVKSKSKAYKHDTRKQNSELKLLKFSKESKSLLSENDSISCENSNSMMKRLAVGTETERELEIENTVYEHESTSRSTVPVVCEVHTETRKNIEPSKRLRFDEKLKMISNIEEADNNWSVSSSIQRINNEDLDKIVEAQETEGSGRDFRRFWGAKGKKSKKIKLKHLS